MRLGFRPSYLQPLSVPLRTNKATQMLRQLHQATGSCHRQLQDVESALKAFRAFPAQAQKEAAEALNLDSEALAEAAEELVAATPKERQPQKAVTNSGLRKQK